MTIVEETNYIKFCDALNQDFKNLIAETKRKYPSVKESGENVQKILRELTSKKYEFDDLYKELLMRSATIVQPLLQGCNTQLQKPVSISLTALQRLATHQLLTEEAAAALVGVLWGLMEANIEEVKILQTTILLITTNNIVKGQNLARALGLCFRLHESKNSATISTATAAIRQCVCAILDRMIQEDKSNEDKIQNNKTEELDFEYLRQNPHHHPKSLHEFGRDVYMLFQDLCLLINKEETIWLQGLNGIMQTLGLELLEFVLIDYSNLFVKHKEFTYLLKEKVCPLIIKLFSPSLKFKPNLLSTGGGTSEKPNFPLVGRLIRMITVIIKNYFYLLNTECEIFMSLLIRFLDTEKPLWQRALALEVLFKCVSEPQLIKHICENYDMKEHSTKIFKEIVNALNSFIQTCFLSQANSQANQTITKDSSSSTNPNIASASNIPAFQYKGICIPIHLNIKILFYDMLDKTEPPNPPSGYSLSLAFLSLLEIIKSVQAIIDGSDKNLCFDDANNNTKLIEACWGGLLSSLGILLESSNDEGATEAILRGLRSMVSMCGEIGLTSSRDAFVTTICKASLPSTLAMSILNESNSFDYAEHHHDPDTKDPHKPISNGAINEEEFSILSNSPNVVHNSISIVSNNLIISDKNIQCVRSLLNVAHCHGSLLGNSWYMVLLCLQHMVSLLGLTITSMGSIIISGKGNINLNSMLSAAVIADLPVLSAMLSRLFECSQLMDQKALNELIDALCKLSKDAIEVGRSNKDPSLFSVAKLMETGLANKERPDIWWPQVLPTLIEATSQPHVTLRQLATDVSLTLIKDVIKVEFEIPFWTNKEMYDLILDPLSQMSSVKYNDVRQKQLDCIQYILHRYGDQIGDSWQQIIEIIGAIDSAISEQLVRNAFQCFQLVNTDYLFGLNSDCYSIIVDVASHFAEQDQDLNISLSAIGSILYIADFFFQQAESMTKSMKQEQIDELWIQIYCNLVKICVDKRPAVRKSAGQTLFNTIELHGDILQLQSWSVIMWKVLFPLLDKVKEFCAVAPEKRSNGNLLMHHSRDTAAKQWAETQFLTLSGVAQIFSKKQDTLLKLNDFPRAWKLLLEFIESSALVSNQEISENSLKSFQTILDIKCENCVAHKPNDESLKLMVWRTWVKIGLESTKLAVAQNLEEILKSNADKVPSLPSPKFLTTLFEMFPQLFNNIQTTFFAEDFNHFSTVIQQTFRIHLLQFSPMFSSSIPSMSSLSMNTEHGYLTSLQKTSLDSLKTLSKIIIADNGKLKSLLGILFTDILSLAELCVELPKDILVVTKNDQFPSSFVSFGENCMELSVEMYKTCANEKLVIENRVLDQIISMLYKPLSLKYNCPSQTSWLLASHCLMTVMQIGISVAKKNTKQSKAMWDILSKTLKDFLFSYQLCPPGLSVEEFQKNQELDCKFVYLIRDSILSDSEGVPDEFIEQLINLLNTGTIDTSSSHFFMDYYLDFDNARSFREDFARLCFETLLEYSYLSPAPGENKSSSFPTQKNSQKATTVSRAAVKTTLEKCHSVLENYVRDEGLSGKCPLPRSRLLEVGFVFKAMCTLLTAFENAAPGRIDSLTWNQIIDLYPLVVDCVTVSGAQFMKCLREVLHKYKSLLNPTKN